MSLYPLVEHYKGQGMGIKRTVLSFADRDSWQRRCGDGVHEITVLAKTMAKGRRDGSNALKSFVLSLKCSFNSRLLN